MAPGPAARPSCPPAARSLPQATVTTPLCPTPRPPRPGAQFCRFFVVFLSLFVAKHGPAAASAQLDKVQPGIIFMLLQQVRPSGAMPRAAACQVPTAVYWRRGQRGWQMSNFATYLVVHWLAFGEALSWAVRHTP